MSFFVSPFLLYFDFLNGYIFKKLLLHLGLKTILFDASYIILHISKYSLGFLFYFLCSLNFLKTFKTIYLVLLYQLLFSEVRVANFMTIKKTTRKLKQLLYEKAFYEVYPESKYRFQKKWH